MLEALGGLLEHPQDGAAVFTRGRRHRRLALAAELIQERFRTFREETYPLVQFYKNEGVYHQVNGMRPIQDVTEEILNIIDKKKVLSPVTNGGK